MDREDRSEAEQAIDFLAELYLDALQAGEIPDIDEMASRLPIEDRVEARKRMRLMDVLHQAKPEPGDGE